MLEKHLGTLLKENCHLVTPFFLSVVIYYGETRGIKTFFFVVMSLLMSWCHIGVEIRGTMTSRFFFSK